MKGKEIFKAGGLSTLIIIGFIAVFLVLSQTGDVIVEQTIREKWIRFNPVGEFEINASSSGYVEVYIVQTGQTYTANLSNTSGYYLGGSGLGGGINNTHISSNINHSEAFDIVLKMSWNKTHMYETTNNTWVPQYVNVTIWCGPLGADVVMTEYNITGQGTSAYLYMHHVAGPYTLSRGQTTNSTGTDWKAILHNFTYYG